jgi:hypothetical protein
MRGSVHFASPTDPNVPSSSRPIHSDRPGFTNSDPLPKAERALTGLLASVAMVDADSQKPGISERQCLRTPRLWLGIYELHSFPSPFTGRCETITSWGLNFLESKD